MNNADDGYASGVQPVDLHEEEDALKSSLIGQEDAGSDIDIGRAAAAADDDDGMVDEGADGGVTDRDGVRRDDGLTLTLVLPILILVLTLVGVVVVADNVAVVMVLD